MLHPSDVLCNGDSIDHVPAGRISPVDDRDFVRSVRLQLTASQVTYYVHKEFDLFSNVISNFIEKTPSWQTG